MLHSCGSFSSYQLTYQKLIIKPQSWALVHCFRHLFHWLYSCLSDLHELKASAICAFIYKPMYLSTYLYLFISISLSTYLSVYSYTYSTDSELCSQHSRDSVKAHQCCCLNMHIPDICFTGNTTSEFWAWSAPEPKSHATLCYFYI